MAALSTAFLLSALPLSYLSRQTVPGGWNVPDVRLRGGVAVNLDEIKALGSRLAELCRK